MENNSLRIYPAKDGDSFLLNFEGILFLIDGGYVNTYRNFIKNDLIRLNKLGFILNYLIVTHIDQDHISGINIFLDENNANEVIPIGNIWHNSLKHLSPKRSKSKLNHNLIIQNLANQSYLKIENFGEKKVSAIQGSTLASLISEGNYNWNEAFNKKAVSIENNTEVNISDKVKLILLSPDDKKIDTLNKFWQRELLKNGFLEEISEDRVFDDAFEIMISKQKQKKRKKYRNISTKQDKVNDLLSIDFQEDDSASNGSSFAFILESKEKRVLFLGDSHPSLVCKSLKKRYQANEFPIYFDFIKVSHHGSFSNNSPELLSLITSDKFILSTNGKKHLHPDLETIAQIITINNGNLTLFFNYSNKTSEFYNNLDYQSKYNYQIKENMKEVPFDIKI